MTCTLFVADLHINSTVALALPHIQKDDGSIENSSRLQKTIYDNWQIMTGRVKELKEEDDLIIVFDGDLGDIKTKYGGYQIHSQNQATVKKHICELIEPLCNLARLVYFVRGTPEHVGQSAYIEELVADDFDNAVVCPDTKAKSWFVLPLELDGIKFEIAHSANMGQMPWTRKNAANQLAAKIRMDYDDAGQVAPDLAIRGHMHRWADSGDNFRTRVIYLPCWTGSSEFVNIVHPGNFSEIGALVVHTNKRKYTLEKLKYDIERRKWHKPPK